MKFKVSDMLLSALSLLSCVGCSVKESREGCPCQLFLDFSEVETASVKSIDVYVREIDEIILSDVVGMEEFSEGYLAYVPRTGLGLCAWSGRGDALTDTLEIPYGEDCPPVYIHSSQIDASHESVSEKVVMRKSFCEMTLNLKRDRKSSFSLAISGNVNGYDCSGAPSCGDFAVHLDSDGNDTFTVNLPRQVDDSLLMEIDTGDVVVKKFPLGQYIRESGYDWNALDLEDITIDLDIAVTHLSVVIQGWEKEYKFDVVI
jgi:hypothetical protein